MSDLKVCSTPNSLGTPRHGSNFDLFHPCFYRTHFLGDRLLFSDVGGRPLLISRSVLRIFLTDIMRRYKQLLINRKLFVQDNHFLSFLQK